MQSQRFRVVRARAMGMCFGVRDALAVADGVDDPGGVAIHGELVHNATVLAELRARGFALAPEDARGVPDRGRVMITAHGVSGRERARLAAAGKALLDTTCPLVRRVHDAARAFANDGRHVVVVGRRGHVEVRGIVGDLASFDVVERVAEVRTWPHDRLGVLSQSTAAERDVRAVLAEVVRRNPHADVAFTDTVCGPTKERQAALERLLDVADAVVVVGGRNSNNTRRLVARCAERAVRACHVVDATELDPAWLAGARTVGLTAGTSTPDATIDEVERRLRAIGGGR